MDFEEFKEKIKGEMERRLKGGKAVVREVIKNNSVRRTGIFLEAPGEGACPVIYLEGPYERLCRGQEFAEVSGEVWGIYLSHAGKQCRQLKPTLPPMYYRFTRM